MANDKLTWTELRKALAEYANISEQEAGQFLSALLDGIIEGLTTDKQVKIKGLGSFALKPVAPRKSVNIATGETFTIEGYNKLSFSPESILKENVEKRLEQPQTGALLSELNNDPIKKLGEQANEIVDILAELGQAVTTPSTDDLEVAEEVVTPEGSKEEVGESKELEEPITTAEEHKMQEEKVVAPKCKCHKWVCWLIGAIILLGVAGTGFYFRETLMQWWQCIQDCQAVVEEGQEVDSIEVQEVVVPSLAEKPREYVNFIGIERIGKDSRLAWIAYKYYAQKDLWVFIYEANRDIIKHPSKVHPGVYIRIPELSEEYRNLYNPELKQLVDSLATDYLTVAN